MNLFQELKHRNVFRVAAAYAVGSWLLAQIADLVLDSTDAPEWIMQVLLLMLAFGFVIALIISWAYEITADGIKRVRENRFATIPLRTSPRRNSTTLRWRPWSELLLFTYGRGTTQQP